jgi:hypothetical protein
MLSIIERYVPLNGDLSKKHDKPIDMYPPTDGAKNVVDIFPKTGKV